jgi:hypothetical protein
VEHIWVVVRHGREVAVRRGSPLLRERAALVSGAIVGVVHCAGVADARGGVSTKCVAELVAWRDVAGES